MRSTSVSHRIFECTLHPTGPPVGSAWLSIIQPAHRHGWRPSFAGGVVCCHHCYHHYLATAGQLPLVLGALVYCAIIPSTPSPPSYPSPAAASPSRRRVKTVTMAVEVVVVPMACYGGVMDARTPDGWAVRTPACACRSLEMYRRCRCRLALSLHPFAAEEKSESSSGKRPTDSVACVRVHALTSATLFVQIEIHVRERIHAPRTLGGHLHTSILYWDDGSVLLLAALARVRIGDGCTPCPFVSASSSYYIIR